MLEQGAGGGYASGVHAQRAALPWLSSARHRAATTRARRSAVRGSCLAGAGRPRGSTAQAAPKHLPPFHASRCATDDAPRRVAVRSPLARTLSGGGRAGAGAATRGRPHLTAARSITALRAAPACRPPARRPDLHERTPRTEPRALPRAWCLLPWFRVALREWGGWAGCSSRGAGAQRGVGRPGLRRGERHTVISSAPVSWRSMAA